MTYAEKLIKSVEDKHSPMMQESTVKELIEQAMQAQRKACAKTYLLYKYSPSGRVERADWTLDQLGIAHEEAEIAQSILKAEVKL